MLPSAALHYSFRAVLKEYFSVGSTWLSLNSAFDD